MERVLVIAGPTASGKSGAAVTLAQKFNGEIINADSLQVYQGVEILTAQPNKSILAAVPHHLYGVLPPDQTYSAGLWRAQVVEKITDILARGKLPIIVGGTGLYLKALTEGLVSIPDIDEKVRTQARALFKVIGAAEYHKLLLARDPIMGKRIKPTDQQRMIRALEVMEGTGRSLAEWQKKQAEPQESFIYYKTLILPERDQLQGHMISRLRGMVAQGVLAEVKFLQALGLAPGVGAMKAVGFKEFARHLRGEMPIEAAVEQAYISTRQYAKRQYTWFNGQYTPDLTVKNAADLTSLIFS